MIITWIVIDILALLTFGIAVVYAQKNFRMTQMTSSVWDFVVLIGGFGSMWAAAWVFSLRVIADMFFVLIVGLSLALLLLSSQESLKPI